MASHDDEEDEMPSNDEAIYQQYLREQARGQEQAAAAARRPTYFEVEDAVRNFRLSTEDALKYQEFLKNEVMRCPYIDMVELEPFRCRIEVEGLTINRSVAHSSGGERTCTCPSSLNS